jgi:hypothetical protein
MSKPILTQLGLTGLAGLKQNQGISINNNLASILGTSTGPNNYTSSKLTTDTILKLFTGNMVEPGITRIAYSKYIIGAADVELYRKLITLGATSLPALTGSRVDALTDASTGWQQKWSFGAYRFIPEQANLERTIATGSYQDFVMMTSMFHSFMDRQNTLIDSFISANSHLDGAYSNLNDLLTGDIAGVSLATLFFGQDLINSGRAIDLRYIVDFGTPSVLLATLKDNNALSKELLVSLIYYGLTSLEISNIASRSVEATNTQEKIIYQAFSIVTGTELANTLIPLNCKTKNLDSLADLLNPRKLFPNSYKTLTVPEYNPGNLPTNSKTYHLIYQGESGVNPKLTPYGEILQNFIPSEIAIACASFSMAMQQIKNIRTMNIEKFANVVSNLEVAPDLTLVGARGPMDKNLTDPFLASISLGSGQNGKYTMSDFLGTISGTGYNLTSLISSINSLTTPELTTRCLALIELLNDTKTVETEVTDPDTGSVSTVTSYEYEADVLEDIEDTIVIINNLLTALAASPEAAKLNALYNSYFEKIAQINSHRARAIVEMEIDLTQNISSKYDIESFMINTMSSYCLETLDTKTAQVIEGFMDLTTTAGQSIVAAMREARNQQRLALVGAVTEAEVPEAKPADSITTISLGVLSIPKVNGQSETPGSLAGSEYDNLVPQNLDIFNIAGSVSGTILTPAEAIENVTTCNCDCWDLIQ